MDHAWSPSNMKGADCGKQSGGSLIDLRLVLYEQKPEGTGGDLSGPQMALANSAVSGSAVVANYAATKAGAWCARGWLFRGCGSEVVFLIAFNISDSCRWLAPPPPPQWARVLDGPRAISYL